MTSRLLHKTLRMPSIVQRGSMFYFRARVPKAHVETCRRREVWKSLRTTDAREAVKRAGVCMAAYDAALASSDNENAMAYFATLSIDYFDNGRVKSIKTDNDTEAERLAALEAHKAAIAAASPIPQVAPQVLPQLPAAAKGDMLLSQLIDDYMTTRSKPDRFGKYAVGWELETKRQEREAACRLLVDLAGDMLLSQVSKRTLDEAFNDLRMLPPNRTKNPKLRGKSIREIINLQTAALKKYEAARNALKTADERAELDQSLYVKFLSYKTLEQYEFAWSGLFQYAIDAEYAITKNHARGMKSGLQKDSVQKSAYSSDELKLIFEGQEYAKRTANDPAKFWIPLLLLYSGARLNEMCQLLCEDIVIDDGVYCIRISDDATARQRVKNDASKRLVPVHSKIIDLGFLEFVESRRKAGGGKLFVSLDDGKSAKHQKYLGNWWNRFLVVVGVKRRGLDAHSFRHTAVKVWKNAGVDVTYAAAICGHSYDEGFKSAATYDLYGGKPSPSVLRKYVEMLDFGLAHHKQQS